MGKCFRADNRFNVMFRRLSLSPLSGVDMMSVMLALSYCPSRISRRKIRRSYEFMLLVFGPAVWISNDNHYEVM
jgi:hypothetical protein